MRRSEVAPVEKLDIACELLDRALRLYYEGDSFFASLHLAGAAEEVLGVYAEKCGTPSSFNSFRSAAAKLAKVMGDAKNEEAAMRVMGELMNRAKNQTKHGHGAVAFDAREEAKDVLDRAVSNYYVLINYIPALRETPLIGRFNNEVKASARESA
jgi:hypothetical protein